MKSSCRFVFLCCALVVAHGYGDSAIGEEAKKTRTIEKKVIQKGVMIVASMPEESICGSGVNVKVQVENQSKQDIEFYWVGKYEVYNLEMHDPMGKAVPLTRFGKIVSAPGRGSGGAALATLAAGARKEAVLNLARVFDLTQPGEYTLTVSHVAASQVKVEKMKFRIVEERP